MRGLTHWFLRSGVTTLVLVTSLHAAEVNQRSYPPPNAQVKINNALAKGYAYSGGGSAGKVAKPAAGGGCGNTQIATSPPARAGRKDTIFVARGDVININRNVRCY